ncbi:SRPBCC domain-containing protein [Occultella gossypii]|uniref:SRPBCC domain-containing protein n=1 Tax=Occultella gossypii TaxID=2800820 RepID=A0ABS7S7F1_9MICO|nr:SRPBCC domain-containing protein [Occultella gossypii]MBZ2196277.1 SRPBCC domain-containing protein [Occultella gossypii]
MTTVDETGAGSIDRRLTARDHEGRAAHVATVSRTYPTTPEDLWQAVTTADRIRRWFVPVTGDLRLGGRYQLEGNAAGEVTACDAPRSFAATWEFGGNVSWIDVRIEAAGDGATFTLEHTAAIPDGPDEFWQTYGPGAVGVGWDLGLLGLSLHLAHPEAERALEDEAAWATSPEGRAFITASSTAWAESNIAFGTPREAAVAAAERTTLFYTGTPSQD